MPGRPTNMVGQGPIVLGVGGVASTFFSRLSISFLSPSLCGTARYRLKYCLKALSAEKKLLAVQVPERFKSIFLVLALLFLSTSYKPCGVTKK